MTDTINNVPRELLVELQEHIDCHRDAVLWGKVCAILSAPSPAGVAGLGVIGWYTDDHLDDKSATTYSREVADRWLAKGWPVTGIANAADAQAIIAGLRGEVDKQELAVCRAVDASNDWEAKYCAERRSKDQQAQRIGELEGLLTAERNKVPLYEAVERACGDLPEGWKVELHMENGAAWIELYDAEGIEVENFPTNNERLDYTINDATDSALSAGKDSAS